MVDGISPQPRAALYYETGGSNGASAPASAFVFARLTPQPTHISGQTWAHICAPSYLQAGGRDGASIASDRRSHARKGIKNPAPLIKQWICECEELKIREGKVEWVCACGEKLGRVMEGAVGDW